MLTKKPPRPSVTPPEEENTKEAMYSNLELSAY